MTSKPPKPPRPLPRVPASPAPPKPAYQDTEARTGRMNRDMSTFQAVAACFDEASPALRLELVELVRGYVAATRERRATVLVALEPP